MNNRSENSLQLMENLSNNTKFGTFCISSKIIIMAVNIDSVSKKYNFFTLQTIVKENFLFIYFPILYFNFVYCLYGLNKVLYKIIYLLVLS